MDSSAPYNPGTVEEVLRDFKGRRAGLIKALTTDAEEFYKQCDPERDNLCLYAFPNEQWEVNLPAEQVPLEVPGPAVGINFSRDKMRTKDWLALIAVHGDAWLISVAFYFSARFGFGKTDRNRLFNMMNDLTPVFDVVVSEIARKQSKQKKSISIDGNSTTKSNSNTKSARYPKPVSGTDENDRLGKEDGEHDGDTLCGMCGEHYASDEFWICCDICERWFHGKCVTITPAQADHIKQYKCPTCNTKEASP